MNAAVHRIDYVWIGLSLNFLCCFAASAAADCSRIVSLAPSVTEVLFAAGFGEKVVAVSDYCTYPEKARSLPRVGGLFDSSFEAILRQRPSVVFALSEQKARLGNLIELGINAQFVDHRSVGGILGSIEYIANLCGNPAAGEVLANQLRSRVEAVKQRAAGLPKLRVMVVVGEPLSDGALSTLYVSGRDGFYSELLDLAGAENIYSGVTGAFSSVSVESVLRMDPQVIIHVIDYPEAGKLNARQKSSLDSRLAAFWRGIMPSLGAVSTGRIYAVTEEYAGIPGPRFVELLEKLFMLLHGA